MRDEFDLLKQIEAPAPSRAARDRAMRDALAAYDDTKKNSAATQGFAILNRLNSGANSLWRIMMTTNSIRLRGMNGAAIAALLLVPAAGALTYAYLDRYDSRVPLVSEPKAIDEKRKADAELEDAVAPQNSSQVVTKEIAGGRAKTEGSAAAAPEERFESDALAKNSAEIGLAQGQLELNAPQSVAPAAPYLARRQIANQNLVANEKVVMSRPMPEPPVVEQQNRDRIENFKTNTVKRVAEEPVSTFSIDVDTASYAWVRRSLKDGQLPAPDSVRVEELINYFDYDWPVPDSAAQPFKPTVTVMPTPWNADTLLMHVAIKGYEPAPAARPHANLVFLVDTSGSMQDADKLPLVKASLKMLLGRMAPNDTISLVTYAGDAGVALEPVKASERTKIIDAIDNLGAGGSTAGSAGLETAYKLAEEGFVKDGVNRIMLATDGDFNVGPSDDESLKKLIEKKRETGIFLSVLGFGQGNYNDQLMQVLAQNGNGTAAYIDTLAEAEKTLVQESGSTLFPIAKDVKIQVEFNPSKISEYRLIGYETRGLAREDFNNDRVDAGDVGAGHSVTAIYELTPVGSPALSVDSLRYGKSQAETQPANDSDELAFVKLRYKKPDGAKSELMSQPVGSAQRVGEVAQASEDVRFSVAVAAFGQKLRDTDAVANFTYEQIGDIAAASRGADSFGYRSEFLSLVRLADGLSSGK